MYIHVGNMDVHLLWEHGCSSMLGTWMYIYVGNKNFLVRSILTVTEHEFLLWCSIKCTKMCAWMYIYVGNMYLHPCWEHGCTSMLGTWMYIHVGNMDVHLCWEHGCTSMLGTWMYIYVGNMDVHP
jgi:hypothetical protein